MRLLFCCEFYSPSVGGVQEVMRQIAEALVKRGHLVTLATTRLKNRTFRELNGVRIEEFTVAGNAAVGLKGEVDRYCDYVLNADVDAILIKAAQQWTFDALWPILGQIRARKVFIPCGFAGLYRSAYLNYFRKMPAILEKLDHLIFYATHYRDIDYVRSLKMRYFSIIPNGASDVEFAVPRDPLFRIRNNISEESFVYLTIGSLTGLKGHLELLKAFSKLDTGGRSAVLILNGNTPSSAIEAESTGNFDSVAGEKVTSKHSLLGGTSHCQKVFQKLMRRIMTFMSNSAAKSIPALIELGLSNLSENLVMSFRVRFFNSLLNYWISKVNGELSQKRVQLTNFPRPELIQAFKNADLFVFASNVEYSPLVLFESAAAGTPFLTVPVGNSEEIASWTGAGMIIPAHVDKNGYTRVSPHRLAVEMRKAMDSPERLRELGNTGYNRWREKYTWEKICLQYESVLAGTGE